VSFLGASVTVVLNRLDVATISCGLFVFPFLVGHQVQLLGFLMNTITRFGHVITPSLPIFVETTPLLKNPTSRIVSFFSNYVRSLIAHLNYLQYAFPITAFNSLFIYYVHRLSLKLSSLVDISSSRNLMNPTSP
jgi:hypothetical protein